VTITGQNFGATQGNSIVTCNGTPLPSGDYSWSATSLVLQECVTNLGPNPIQITVNGVSSTVAVISGIPDASLSSASPFTAPVGAPVLIRGANLGASQGQSTVTINGVAASPMSWSPTGIVVPVPAGATGPVRSTWLSAAFPPTRQYLDSRSELCLCQIPFRLRPQALTCLLAI
jgi:hypothetical protein